MDIEVASKVHYAQRLDQSRRCHTEGVARVDEKVQRLLVKITTGQKRPVLRGWPFLLVYG